MERKLRSRKKFTKTIWKCLEWIIYFFLTSTAILFAREVIEKFFGHSTGIKQSMEKIESHPTVTICQFQVQCDRPGDPNQIIIKLEGTAKDAQSRMEGTYILGANLVNGKAHWIQDGTNALWYDKMFGNWIIDEIWHLGSGRRSGIYSPDDSVGPLEATTWKYAWLYYSNTYWIESTEITILPGI